MNVSKELLNEVLGEQVNEIQILKNKAIFGGIQLWISSESHDVAVNIYELQHKCKMWAFHIDCTMIVSSVSEAGMGIASIRDENGKIIYCAVEDSEPEAVFAACQWLLDNKDKQ